MKKFYKEATVVETAGGFSITLDGRPVKTPMKIALEVQSKPLAEAIADEWNEQGDEIDPATMPMTGLANAMIDRIAPDPTATIDELVRYLGSDMVCYRADDGPLLESQNAIWGAYQTWFEEKLGEKLAVTSGIMPVSQSEKLLDQYRSSLNTLTAHHLTALKELTGLLGSAVLGFALLEGFKDAAAIWHASDLERVHQADLWGTDEEAEEVAAKRRKDFEDAFRFLSFAN